MVKLANPVVGETEEETAKNFEEWKAHVEAVTKHSESDEGRKLLYGDSSFDVSDAITWGSRAGAAGGLLGYGSSGQLRNSRGQYTGYRGNMLNGSGYFRNLGGVTRVLSSGYAIGSNLYGLYNGDIGWMEAGTNILRHGIIASMGTISGTLGTMACGPWCGLGLSTAVTTGLSWLMSGGASWGGVNGGGSSGISLGVSHGNGVTLGASQFPAVALARTWPGCRLMPPPTTPRSPAQVSTTLGTKTASEYQ